MSNSQPMELSRIEIGGTPIAFADAGTGPAVVLLHSLATSHEIWRPQIEALSRRFRVIAPDIRGFGRSGRLGGFRQVLARQADDLEALLDHLGIDRAAVCGVSFGGVLAQRFALDHPDRVAALVVMDSFADFSASSPQMRLLIAGQLVALPLYLLPKRMFVSSATAPHRRWPDAQRQLRAAMGHGRGWEAVKTRLALNRIDYRTSLTRLQVPTLGIVGDRQPIAVALMNRFVEAVPNARLEVVHDAFDPSNLCQPQAVNELLLEFFNGIQWARSRAGEEVVPTREPGDV